MPRLTSIACHDLLPPQTPHVSKPVLVTGGAGFIGSHLVERLLAAGESVVVLDDLSTGRRPNLAAIATHPRLRLIEGRVSALPDLAALVGQCGFVFHLAAAVGVELVVNSPIRTIETNLREAEAILGAASAGGVPLIFTSTSEVYGKSAKAVFREDDDLLIGPPTLGRWSYACSKLMDEFLRPLITTPSLRHTKVIGSPPLAIVERVAEEPAQTL